MYRFTFLCAVIAAINSNHNVNGARILGVFPIPSISHQVVFRALTYELARRGHELVVITPDPGLPKDRPKDNITEIDTSSTYEVMAKFFKRDGAKRGCVHVPEEMSSEDTMNMIEILDHLFSKPSMQAILKDKSQKFDLIMVEAIFTSPLILGKYFDAPVIWFSSFYGFNTNFEALGAPFVHPIIYPGAFRTRVFNLSFWERVKQSYSHYVLDKQTRSFLPLEQVILEKYFKEYSGITVRELWDSVDLVFFNANPVFEGNRPVPPNVVYLGGLHMQPRKDVPLDLKAYLDNSKRGVVYFSLGTNVHFGLMDADLVETFIEAVEKLPYDVLWKIDEKDLPRKPKNVLIQKWFPQRDLLHHPNVKAFITQGGLQSADETIEAGVPVVILPMLGDQWYNAEQYVRLGVGIQLDVLTLKTEHLVEAVKTVITDESYRNNMKKLSSIMQDQPEKPLDRAVWWTEYVIRHGGAKHLRSQGANVCWAEYLLLDVVGVILGSVLAVLVLVVAVIRRLFGAWSGTSRKGKKVKKN